MITPKEIESKDFTKAFRGYDADEVDEFLDLIIIDMQQITEEITKLREENEELRAENEEHKKSQKRVMDTLDSAKKLMRDISESAEMILNEAKTSAGKYAGADGDELRDKVAYFRSRFRQLLLDELDSMESKGGDLLSALEREFVPTSLGDLEPLGEFQSFDELPEGSTLAISEDEMEKALSEVKDDFEFAVKLEEDE